MDPDPIFDNPAILARVRGIALLREGASWEAVCDAMRPYLIVEQTPAIDTDTDDTDTDTDTIEGGGE
jgi:hypothetical protein